MSISVSAARVAGEAVAAADAAHRLDDAGARQLGQHLGQVVRRDVVLLGDLAPRHVPLRRGCELEHAVQRQRGCSSAVSSAAPACDRRSISSGISGPAIMPWLRKNDRISVLSRDSMVRSLRTPIAPKQRALMASSSCVPTPAGRARVDVDGEDPAAGRRAELPVAHLADDEADDAPPRHRDQERAARRAGRCRSAGTPTASSCASPGRSRWRRGRSPGPGRRGAPRARHRGRRLSGIVPARGCRARRARRRAGACTRSIDSGIPVRK